ncbi:MAG: helix-turn-helix domain-containing protein [Thermoplasmata archaeon]|nr:helix-turn-helix domain-containing protein [Thermoplasmata archaeon]
MRKRKGFMNHGHNLMVLAAVLAIFTMVVSLQSVRADDMFLPSDNSSPHGYLAIDFKLDQDVVSSGDSLYVVVEVTENDYPVDGAEVQLYSTNPDNVTITVIDKITDQDGLARFIIVGDVHIDTIIFLNAMATYNGHETALNSQEVTIVPVISPILTREVWYIGAGAILLLTLGAIATEVGKYGLFKVVFIPLYSRVKKEEVLDHFVRGQIYGYIMSHPGSHYNAIKQELKVTNGTLSHHLRTLEMQGFVKSHRDGTYKRFYPMGAKHPDNKGIRLSDLQLSIIDTLRQTMGMTQSEIAATLGMSQQSISYNLNILVRKDILRYERNGVRKHYFINEEAA